MRLLSIILGCLLMSMNTFADGEDITGEVSRTVFERLRYDWMVSGMKAADETWKTQNTDLFAKKMKGISLEIYIGTWCDDTHEQLPRFFSLLNKAKVNPEIKIFALNRKKTYRGFENERAIEKVPTFVFMKNGKELGRIVETPKGSLLDESLEILESEKDTRKAPPKASDAF